MRSRFYLGTVLVAAMTSATLAQEAATPQATYKRILPKIELHDGDTLVFLGDSITHQCLYTQYVEDYFYTRYPNKRIHFHNAGVGGDRANDALIRLDEDVAKFNPKYVTILLGMNDGSYTNFKQDVFDTYQADMTELLDRLASAGSDAIPMTPTMFDSRAAKIRDKGAAGRELRNDYYNGVLAFYGAWLQEQAFHRGLGFVDMHSPLNDWTVEQRKADADFTLIKDAVHPGPPGQVVMALAVLEDMHANRQVSAISAFRTARDEWKVNAVGGEVSDSEGSADSLKFTFLAEALPWVLPEEAMSGYKLSKAGQKMSRERIRVTGLAPGRKYTLKIDGDAVGEYNAQKFADGFDLHSNEKTPQYRQALAVAEFNKERNLKAIRPLRNMWSQRKGRRRAIERANTDEEISAKRQAMEEWLPEFSQRIAMSLALAKEYEDKIYAANQPTAHVYEISR